MANHLAHIKTLMLKEVKQILSDKSVLLVAFFLPLMLVVIYGTGIRMDVKPSTLSSLRLTTKLRPKSSCSPTTSPPISCSRTI